jgi:NADH dehydrogenase [ubiquinone] 1 alpha subcomplex assembly factor 7
MSALAEIIKREIRDNGPMDLGRYMDLCLGHSTHGYYMTRDPFGVQGDFTTAPEISQLFGEVIGAWIADAWFKMGAPNPVHLVECGPGRGTLMADLLRVIKVAPGFYDAVRIHLLEMSPVLREKQEQSLSGHTVTWHTGLDTIPDDAPLMIIGNEFLDALPIRRFMSLKGGWVEEVITLNEKGDLSLGLGPADPGMVAALPAMLFKPAETDCIEISPVLNQFLGNACNRLQKQGGFALFIDYGYPQTACGKTLQAVKKHQSVSILETPGEADLTAHVNFETVGTIAMQSGLTVHGPVEQGDYLNRIGITHRQAILNKNATDRQKQDMRNSIDRLTGYNQMGRLFKVIGISADPALNLEGFA